MVYTNYRGTSRILNIVHDLDSKDLKKLSPRERKVLDCVLNNKPLDGKVRQRLPVIFGGSFPVYEDKKNEIPKLKAKLISIRAQKNETSSSPKSSLKTRILSKIGLLPNTQKLLKTSEKRWHEINPTDAECKEALEKAINEKNKEQIFGAVVNANPETAKDLIVRGMKELAKLKGYDAFKSYIPILQDMIDPINIKIHSFKFEELADSENYEEISRIIDEQKNKLTSELDALNKQLHSKYGDKLKSLKSEIPDELQLIDLAMSNFQSILEAALDSFSSAKNSKSKDLRMELVNILYDHVAKQKDDEMFPYFLKEAMYSLPRISSNDKDLVEIYAKFEKLKNDIPLITKQKFRF